MALAIDASNQRHSQGESAGVEPRAGVQALQQAPWMSAFMQPVRSSPEAACAMQGLFGSAMNSPCHWRNVGGKLAVLDTAD